MITASKAQTFVYGLNPGVNPNIMICIKNLPKPWSSGYTYLSEDQTKELIKTLETALEENYSLIF